MIGCEHNILIARGTDYHKVTVAHGLGRIQKKLDIFRVNKYNKSYYSTCMCILKTCMHTYVYVYTHKSNM